MGRPIHDHRWKNTIGQLPNRVCGGEGPVSEQLARRIVVLHLVGYACGNMHAISRTQMIGPALYEHASSALDYRNGFTELVDVVWQKPTWLEPGYAGTKTRGATCFGDEGLQVYAAGSLSASASRSRAEIIFSLIICGESPVRPPIVIRPSY